MLNLKRHLCKKCECTFDSNEYIYDEHGTGYATKLVKCPECGELVVVEYLEDYAMQVLSPEGLDYRYYKYI